MSNMYIISIHGIDIIAKGDILEIKYGERFYIENIRMLQYILKTYERQIVKYMYYYFKCWRPDDSLAISIKNIILKFAQSDIEDQIF